MLKTIKALRGEDGEIAIFACFFVVGAVMLIASLLLYASVQINVLNIKNGARMEMNNLAASIYAQTFRSQREADLAEYLRMLNSSPAFRRQLEQSVSDGLAAKVPLETESYRISNIRLEFNLAGNRIEYVFICDVEFFVTMFGARRTVITRQVRLTGHHNTKF